MATRKSQRIFIWIIAIVMTVGTIAGFVAMMLGPENAKIDQAQQEAAYKKIMAEQQAAQQKSLKPLEGYEATPFNKDDVKELQVETLQEGDGEVLSAQSTISANYFGWTSDGKLFDSTNKDGTTTPIDFSLQGVIQGWTKGLTGVKVGSTVKLLIPGDQAYGNTDNGDGRPFGPLAFIVEVKAVK